VTVGLQHVDLCAAVLKRAAAAQAERTDSRAAFLAAAGSSLVAALSAHASAISSLCAEGLAAQADRAGGCAFAYRGLDSSVAPLPGAARVTDLYDALLPAGSGGFGGSGTLEVSSFLTAAFKAVRGAPLVGYSGLMLPPLEDEGLAAAARRGTYDLMSLLQYSAVCGIGLDTVPVPGDVPAERVAALMADVGALAFRLNKPLSVRLFPVPGVGSDRAGQDVEFNNPNLCQCPVFAIP
jgi:hypothetical protein